MEKKLKNTNENKNGKNNEKIHINNKMPALWDSKVTFVSVSQFLELACRSPFGSASAPFITPHPIVSLGGRKKKKEKEDRGKKKK